MAPQTGPWSNKNLKKKKKNVAHSTHRNTRNKTAAIGNLQWLSLRNFFMEKFCILSQYNGTQLFKIYFRLDIDISISYV